MRRTDSELECPTRRGFLLGVSGATAVAGCSGEGRPTNAHTEDVGSATASDSTGATAETNSSTALTETERMEAITTVDPPTVEPPDSFIDTRGETFVLNGDEVVVRATSNSRLLQPWTRRALLDEVVEEAAAMGMNAIRIWAFRNGVPTGGADPSHCLQPRPGVYGEAAFGRFDYLIEKAKRHGIRLIPALVNNWDPYGSMKDYVRWSDTAEQYPEAANGRGMVHDAFYTDEGARKLYQDYVKYVLTRENAITGVEYRDDPTILMWELANEPRAHATSAERLQRWIEEMGTFVKSIDSNHLLSTGSEGFYTDGEGHWMYTGATGVDYLKNHRPDAIDAASFHCWPDHWDISVDRSVEWIERHVSEAHDDLGKPSYLGEYGWPVDRTRTTGRRRRQMRKRNDAFERWHATLRATNCNGAAVWQHRGHDYASGSETPPLKGASGKHADPYALYHPEDKATIRLLRRYASRE